MSGAVKSIKKHFKKVGSAIKKLWKNKIVRAIVIAVAIYFTAGAAAAYFAPAATAGTAAGATAGMTAAEVSTAMAGIAEGEAVGSVIAAGASEGAAAAAAGAVGEGAVAGAIESAASSGIADAAAGTAVDAATGAVGAADAAGTAGSGIADAAATGATDVAGIAPGATEAATSVPQAVDVSGAMTDPTGGLMQSATPSPVNAGGEELMNAAMSEPGTVDLAGNMGAPAGGGGSATPGTGSMWDTIQTAGDKFLTRAGEFLKTPQGMNAAGQAMFGLGKGVLDSRAQEEQMQWADARRRWGSAQPDITGYYTPGVVGRRIARGPGA